MKTETLQQLRSANQKFLLAQNELNRPSEDVVPISVCFSVRQSMLEWMQGFLQFANHTGSKDAQLDNLLAHCRACAPAFNSVKLDAVMCCKEDSSQWEKSYCLAVSNLCGCLKTASEIKAQVMKALNLTEKEI